MLVDMPAHQRLPQALDLVNNHCDIMILKLKEACSKAGADYPVACAASGHGRFWKGLLELESHKADNAGRVEP